MNFTGICKSDYNIIDQKHIDSSNKKIWVTTLDTPRIKQFWSLRSGKVIFEDRVIVHIRGRGNYSHILNRTGKYYVNVQPSFGGRSRFVLDRIEFPDIQL